MEDNEVMKKIRFNRRLLFYIPIAVLFDHMDNMGQYSIDGEHHYNFQQSNPGFIFWISDCSGVRSS